ncbi:tyrosine-type recombinase/integrase [Roseitalea porphyridii]|uniref:Site-specific integrase n=1 Tax=Roseitalea porphyridii TaxID=1852022 RepID=A0A4P6V1P1_9HYPH|nr:site-specific integrase [Roseitalea porphyridii]QBK30783.1 site-specific integrase [Roseitalea porphyridii]
MAKALTAVSIDRLKPTEKRQEIADARQPGLYLIVQPSGKKSWAIRYRHPETSKPAKFTIGAYPTIELADAREQAARLLIDVDRGIDPMKAKREAAAEAQRKADEDSDLVENVIDRFITRYVLIHTPRSAYDTRRIFDYEIKPAWKGRRIQDITRRDVNDLLDGIMEGTAEHRTRSKGPAPYIANRVLSALSRFGNWCVERGIIETSFAAGVKKPHKEASRDRRLSDDEVRWLLAACDEIGEPFGPLVKLLLLTGQRRDEVGKMTWPEIDTEARVWTLAADRMKGGREHTVPLSEPVLAILGGLTRIKSPAGYVFTVTGETAVSGFSKAKRRLDELMLAQAREEAGDEPIEFQPWRYHDLRRTAASGMAALRIQPHVVEAVLGHRTGAVSGVALVYNRHSYHDEKAAALDAWAGYVDRLVSGEAAGSKVVALSRASQ